MLGYKCRLSLHEASNHHTVIYNSVSDKLLAVVDSK